MAVLEFPDPCTADENGLVAIGGDLECSSLQLAYTKGIFPWPISEDYPLAWFSPDPRGILECTDLHIPKSLQKVLRKSPFQIKFNTNFEQVIRQCSSATNRAEGEDSWITESIIQAYIDLHNQNMAYSVEAYNDKHELVGGVYGVNFGKLVSGESMFYLEPNASKACLITLIERLIKLDIPFLDTQMVTPVVKSLGGKEISRKDYLERLEKISSTTLFPSLF
jgi:leucyl/phenylalanyl-tRNA---protein transferase